MSGFLFLGPSLCIFIHLCQTTHVSSWEVLNPDSKAQSELKENVEPVMFKQASD